MTMISDRLTDEQLAEILSGVVEGVEPTTQEVAMAAELQERRKAAVEPVLYVMGMGCAFDAETASTCKGAVDSWVGEWNQERLPGQEEYRTVPLYTAPPASEREKVRREHAEWSDATFGDVGPVGPLKHLSKEALEAAADPSNRLEWADMQFLLWDAQRRAGISDEQITQAMVEKLVINKARQWPEPKDGEPRLHIKEEPAPVMPPGLHPDTQKLVADFSTDLAEKLYKAQLKYGYDADWKQDNWSAQCLAHFHQHIAKGDPRDVAAYCAFMWYHDWKTEPATVPIVPDEITSASAPEVFEITAEAERLGLCGTYASYAVGWNACRAAMLQGK